MVNRWNIRIDRVRGENLVSMAYQNGGPWVAYEDYDALSNSHDKLVEALRGLVDLNDSFGPFGGEIYQDKVDRLWDKAKAVLEAL